MIYRTLSGETIDTARELDFEERNFIQKMMIFQHLGLGLEEFRARWQTEKSPVRQAQGTRPGPALRIILDLEQRIRTGSG